jgi:nucleotide-binding universal stress UspA family protein
MKRKSSRAPKQAPVRDGVTIRKILVPIDFSEPSKNALSYAVPFAQHFGAELLLIYVVEPALYPADFSFGQVAIPDVERELRQRGNAELKELSESHIRGLVPSRVKVCTGKPFLEIIRTAREEGSDMIIIASHGHTGVEHLLFGSTAEKVVRKASCPVLVLRPEE